MLAGIAVGIWDNADQVTEAWTEQRRFVPAGDSAELADMRARWAAAVERA
ncbi:MAG: glycerol kinase [Kiritimatiellia bacterium]